MTESVTPYDRARDLLRTPAPRASAWSVLAAMALAATAAVLMAGAVILGPGFELVATETVASAYGP